MISDGTRDTEDCRNDAESSAFKISLIEKQYLMCNISYYYIYWMFAKINSSFFQKRNK